MCSSGTFNGVPYTAVALTFLLTLTGDDPILYLVLVSGCVSVGKIGESDIYRITGTTFISLRNLAFDEERVVELRKLLNAGTFYFSWSAAGGKFDLSLCAQKCLNDQMTDNRFFWYEAGTTLKKFFNTLTAALFITRARRP